MSGVQERTESLWRGMWPTLQLKANDYNPNEMDDKTFNMLADNIELMGITDPILCKLEDGVNLGSKEGVLLIIGGQHRWEVSKLYELEEVPVTVVTDPEFDGDRAKAQVIRHNIIHGKMSPQKFMKLYMSLSEQYTKEAAAELFGFTDQTEFHKLLGETRSSLPPELQASFDEAKGELKTIDDLSSLLNRLFSQYGDSLPYGYMIFDFGGKDSVWLRLAATDLANFKKLATRLKGQSKTLDGFMSKLLQLIASDSLDSVLDPMIAELPEVNLRSEAEYPTLDFLDD